MPIAAKCPQCSVGLRIPDDKAGKVVRCPKCQQVFRAPGPAKFADLEVVDEPSAKPSPTGAKVSQGISQATSTSEASSAPAKSNKPALKTKRKKRKKEWNSGWVGGIGGAVFGVLLAIAVGVYHWYYTFGPAAKRTEADIADFVNILETAGKALEMALQPQQRPQAVKLLNEQAGRLNNWVNTHANERASQWVINRAMKQHEQRLISSKHRWESAMAKLQQDQTAVKDPQLQAALQNWDNAIENFNRAAKK